MEEKLTLFDTETSNEELELGKKIWNIYNANPQYSLVNIFKKLNITNDFLGRRAFWSYVILEKCELREHLKIQNKEHLLNGIKSYIFVNYRKLIKAKVGTPKYIDEDFKEYICNFFITTCKLSEKDMRQAINNEAVRLEIVDCRDLNIIDDEKEILRTDIYTLKKQINILKKENEKLRNNQKDTETIISEYSSKVKQDIFRVTSRFMIAISIMMLAVSVLK